MILIKVHRLRSLQAIVSIDLRERLKTADSIAISKWGLAWNPYVKLYMMKPLKNFQVNVFAL